MSKLQKGDLVFWTKKCTCGRWREIHHVGIFDEGKMNFESSSSRGKVVRRELWESSSWQIVLVADITSLIKGDEIMLQKGDKGDAVYLYQHACLKAGFDPLDSGKNWKDMKTGEVNGCDGVFGDYTEAITKQAQAKHGLEQTGKVDAITYGNLASDIKGEDLDKIAKLQKTIDENVKRFIAVRNRANEIISLAR